MITLSQIDPKAPGSLDIPAGDPPMDAGMSSTFASPWMRVQEDQSQEERERRARQIEKLDAAILDPESFFKKNPFNPQFADDPEKAKRRVIVAGYLRHENGGKPLPMGADGHEMMRRRVAAQRFEGRGADDDDAFHGELVKAATRRKDEKDIRGRISTAALDDALMPAGQSGGFAKVRESLKSHMGYDPAREAEYFEEFHRTRMAAAAGVEEFRPQLDAVWNAFETEGDVGSAAREAYDAMPDAETRLRFLAALRLRAGMLAPEQQPSFWSNVGKQSGRDIAAFGRDALGFAQTNTEAFSDIRHDIAGGGMPDLVPSQIQRRLKDRETNAAQDDATRREMDFIADVRHVQESTFDPVKYLAPDDTWSQAAERGAYGAPGAVVTSATAAVPGFGMAAFYASSHESAYQQYRREFEAAGMDYDTAAANARTLAPVAAVPQVLMERLQLKAIRGKLPMLESLVGKAAAKVPGRAGQFALRGLVGTVEETALEKAQDIVPSFVQDIAHALESDIPDVTWSNGKNGVLDGFWKDSASLAVTMLPLAIFGAGVGVVNDQRRIAEISAASDRQLLALGASPEAVSNVRMAKTFAEQTQAVETLVSNLDPQSETARDAVEELKTQQAAMESLRASGALPEMVRSADGWSVVDPETGEEVGTSPDLAGAWRIAQSHSDFLADMRGDAVAYMATMLESADFLADADPNTTTRLELGKVMDMALMEAENPQSAARYAAQVALREQAAGGDGSMAYAILGRSETELRENLRHTVNRIYQGGSVLTVFHEFTHGKRREARAAGRITRADEIAFLRALDQVMAGKRTRNGEALRFIPETLTDDRISEELIDEAISEVMEAEILRTREGGKTRRTPAGRSGVVKAPSGFITRNLNAIARLAPGATEKFSAFIDAVRAHFGLALSRALALRKAEKEGRFDRESYDAFLHKLMGTDEKAEFDRLSSAEFQRVFQMEEDPADDIPFSLGRSNVHLDLSGNNNSIKTNDPGGANIGDAASPFNVVTPEMDAEYLAAVESGDTQNAQRMVDEAARKSGYDTETPLYHGSRTEFEKFGDEHKGRSGLNDDEYGFHFFDSPEPAKEYGIVTVWYHRPDNADVYPTTFDAYTSVDDMPFGPIVGEPDESVFHPAHFWDTDGVGEGLREILRKDGVVAINGEIGGKTVTQYVVRDSEMLLRADPFIKDASGNIIPLSRRFNQSPPADSGGFSIAPSRGLDLMRMDALSRVKNPRRRAEIFQRVSREFARLKLDAERLELTAGSKRLRKSLLKEAAMREAQRADELEREAYARHFGVLSNDELVKIKSQPVHAYLSDPHSPLRGRLMSRTAAVKMHPDMFLRNSVGEYDGSEGISRSVFGGRLMPDQAAAELFDAGLIRENTPDAMWDALRSEQAMVDKMKEAMGKAMEDIRSARAQAKAETNEWLKGEGAKQATEYSPRQEVIRALAALDAILRPLPPEIRGRIGGYQQMARIAGVKEQVAFLKETIAKADAAIETWMRSALDQEFRDLLKQTRPERDEAGRKPRGKIGANVHDLFRAVEESMGLEGPEVEAVAAGLEAQADLETTSEEQRAHLLMEANLIRLAGNWLKADAARREAALEAAAKAYYGGYMEAMIKSSARRSRIAAARAKLRIATGKAGERMEVIEREIKDSGTKLGRAKEWLLSLYSFDQVLSLAFGENSETAAMLRDWELRASNAKEDAIQRANDELESLLESLANGKYKGEALRWKLVTDRNITVTDWKGRKQTFSQLEAITFSLMWDQEDGRRHMEGITDDEGNVISDWHWREEDREAVERQLSKDALAVRAHIREAYAAEYDRINAVFSDLYGVNMPRHKNYAPITVAPTQQPGGQIADPVSGSMVGPGLTPGSLKNRSNTAVAKPDFRDALQTFIAHNKQMEHFIAYAPFASEAMAALNNREVLDSIKAKAGKEAANVLRAWIDHFAQGGTRDAAAHLAANKGITRMLGRLSAAALVGRVSVLAVQSLQLGAALYNMPVGAFLTRLARLSTGQLGWGDAIRSEFIQRRLKQMPPAVRQAMEGLAGGKPNRVKFFAERLGRSIAGADALFTAGTYAMIYDYQLKQARAAGIPNAESFARAEAERQTDTVAQPTRAGARSLAELTGGTYLRVFWAFASEPRQKIALAAHAIQTKQGAAAVKPAAVTWLVSGMVATLLRAVIRDLRDDGEDEDVFDERAWNPARLMLMAATGPFQGLPLVGDLIEESAAGAADVYSPGGTIVSSVPKAFVEAKEIVTGDREWEDAIRSAETIMNGAAAASGTASAVTSALHILRDLEALWNNTTQP